MTRGNEVGILKLTMAETEFNNDPKSIATEQINTENYEGKVIGGKKGFEKHIREQDKEEARAVLKADILARFHGQKDADAPLENSEKENNIDTRLISLSEARGFIDKLSTLSEDTKKVLDKDLVNAIKQSSSKDLSGEDLAKQVIKSYLEKRSTQKAPAEAKINQDQKGQETKGTPEPIPFKPREKAAKEQGVYETTILTNGGKERTVSGKFVRFDTGSGGVKGTVLNDGKSNIWVPGTPEDWANQEEQEKIAA